MVPYGIEAWVIFIILQLMQVLHNNANVITKYKTNIKVQIYTVWTNSY